MMLNHLLSRQAIDYATPTWFCQKPYHYNRHNTAKMKIIDNNISYVIPLDEIDLNYCYSKDFFSDEPMPLWNKNSNNYYELKIFAQRKRQLFQNEINGTDEFFTENPKYKCHVCNVSVPVVYKKEHINSQKHKTCLKIMDTAMVRARFCLIQSKDDNQQLKTAQHSYYCELCCAQVKIKNRKDHDMSKDHFKSLMHDKFLNDLLNIYIDKEHLEKVDFEYMTNDSTSNHSGNGNYQKYKSDSDISYEDLNVNDEINKFLDLMQKYPCNESENETSKPLSLTDNEVNTSNEIQDYKLTITNGT
ncbi:hypothetical protein evm_010152 [Chilo suppressalis]|nr:hypothetical protein evm_010152 [Chilo suppressalis]